MSNTQTDPKSDFRTRTDDMAEWLFETAQKKLIIRAWIKDHYDVRGQDVIRTSTDITIYTSHQKNFYQLKYEATAPWQKIRKDAISLTRVHRTNNGDNSLGFHAFALLTHRNSWSEKQETAAVMEARTKRDVSPIAFQLMIHYYRLHGLVSAKCELGEDDERLVYNTMGHRLATFLEASKQQWDRMLKTIGTVA